MYSLYRHEESERKKQLIGQDYSNLKKYEERQQVLCDRYKRRVFDFVSKVSSIFQFKYILDVAQSVTSYRRILREV